MTTYFCKCGKTFRKNTEAGTTGFRMPDYGPDHECYGCPFVCKVLTWDPMTQQQAVQNHECRASKSIRYGTTAGISVNDKCTANIFTLDFDFLKRVHEFAESMDGFEPDRYFLDQRSSLYGVDGRYRYTLCPFQNKKGLAAKTVLRERFFYADGSRKDVTPEQEKEIVLNQIKEAKAVAQGKTEPSGMAYIHGNFRYSVSQREDNNKFTVFLSAPELGQKMEVPDIPDFDTFAEAQDTLDGYALKHKFAAERSAPGEEPEMEQQTFGDVPAESDDSVPPVENSPETEQADDPPESGDNGADSADGTDKMSDSGDDPDDSENDQSEEPPQTCDWPNASGEEEHPENDENPRSEIPAGERVSLRDMAFSDLLNACDSKINAALRVAVETKQSFTFQAKVTFDYRGGAFAIKHETGYQFDPIKVKDKSELAEEIQIILDKDGNPVIPYDREHQLSFDDDTASGGTATVDGKTGIIESYQTDPNESGGEETVSAEDSATAGSDEAPAENPSEKVYPCKNINCPFYVYDTDGPDASGCDFSNCDPAKGERDPFDVAEAVEQNGCTRPEILQAYAEAHPVEDENNESEDEES